MQLAALLFIVFLLDIRFLAGYFPMMYANMARLFGLRYSYVTAAPDSLTFLGCLDQRRSSQRSSNITAAAVAVKQVWETQVKQFFALLETESGGKQAVPRGPNFHDHELLAARDCARLQNLALPDQEVTQLTQQISSAVEKLC
jgi:hypothetical protein